MWHILHGKDTILSISINDSDEARVPAKLLVYLVLNCDVFATVLFSLTRPWRFHYVTAGQDLQNPRSTAVKEPTLGVARIFFDERSLRRPARLSGSH